MSYEQQEAIYKALANRRRLAILAYLSHKTTATVGQIAEYIKLSFSATSKHLQILKSARLVFNRQLRLEQHYSIAKNNQYIKDFLKN